MIMPGKLIFKELQGKKKKEKENRSFLLLRHPTSAFEEKKKEQIFKLEDSPLSNDLL